MFFKFMLIRFVVIVGVNVLCVMFYFLIRLGMVKLISCLLNLFMMIDSVVRMIIIFWKLVNVFLFSMCLMLMIFV